MDSYNARLLSAISDVLLGIHLESAEERAELEKISVKLKALSVGIADDLCCESISRELEGRGAAKPPRKRLS